MKIPIRLIIASTIALSCPLTIVDRSFAEAFNPPNEGEPVHTMGGASRGACSSGPVQDVKFFQKQNDQSQTVLEAHLPAGLAQQVFFSLRGENNETLYQGFLPVDAQTNTVRVNYQSLGNLQEAPSYQAYQWSMAIICGQALRPDSPVFQGML